VVQPPALNVRPGDFALAAGHGNLSGECLTQSHQLSGKRNKELHVARVMVALRQMDGQRRYEQGEVPAELPIDSYRGLLHTLLATRADAG
jgi:hypothetical protein